MLSLTERSDLTEQRMSLSLDKISSDIIAYAKAADLWNKILKNIFYIFTFVFTALVQS